jgi:hypothetical protein
MVVSHKKKKKNRKSKLYPSTLGLSFSSLKFIFCHFTILGKMVSLYVILISQLKTPQCVISTINDIRTHGGMRQGYKGLFRRWSGDGSLSQLEQEWSACT